MTRGFLWCTDQLTPSQLLAPPSLSSASISLGQTATSTTLPSHLFLADNFIVFENITTKMSCNGKTIQNIRQTNVSSHTPVDQYTHLLHRYRPCSCWTTAEGKQQICRESALIFTALIHQTLRTHRCRFNILNLINLYFIVLIEYA